MAQREERHYYHHLHIFLFSPPRPPLGPFHLKRPPQPCPSVYCLQSLASSHLLQESSRLLRRKLAALLHSLSRGFSAQLMSSRIAATPSLLSMSHRCWSCYAGIVVHRQKNEFTRWKPGKSRILIDTLGSLPMLVNTTGQCQCAHRQGRQGTRQTQLSVWNARRKLKPQTWQAPQFGHIFAGPQSFTP